MASTEPETKKRKGSDKKWYVQGFINKWLDDPAYKSWLVEVEKQGQQSSARCTVCDCHFKNPNTGALNKDMNSIKHQASR